LESAAPGSGWRQLAALAGEEAPVPAVEVVPAPAAGVVPLGVPASGVAPLGTVLVLVLVLGAEVLAWSPSIPCT